MMQKPTKTFHVYLVYLTSKDSPYKVVEMTGAETADEVKALLPPNVQWYVVPANSPEKAVAFVDSTDFREKYHEPGGMKALTLESAAFKLKPGLAEFKKAFHASSGAELAPPLKVFHKMPRPIDGEQD